MKIDAQKLRREQMRWVLLLALNNARPVFAHESILLLTLQDIYPDTTERELRRELDYLNERDLVEIEKSPDNIWRSRLTRHGIDMAEYTIDCEPGIARPAKYW